MSKLPPHVTRLLLCVFCTFCLFAVLDGLLYRQAPDHVLRVFVTVGSATSLLAMYYAIASMESIMGPSWTTKERAMAKRARRSIGFISIGACVYACISVARLVR